MEVFKKASPKSDDILHNHRLNLEDVCLIFSAPRIRSSRNKFEIINEYIFFNLVNDAQKVRAKKSLDDVLNGLRDQHAFFELDQPQKQQEISDDSNQSLSTNELPLKSQLSNRNNTSERRNHPTSSAARRSVSFADEVNVLNDDEETYLNQRNDLPATIPSNEQDMEEDLSSPSFTNSSTLILQNEEKFNDSDYYSLSSSPSFHHQYQQQQNDSPGQSKYNLPSKYRLPLASEVLVNKMDSNLRMLIIKELSKSGHAERPLSRMSKIF